MLRISATTLESFRLWRQPEQDWMTEDALIANIRGEFVPTPAVKIGHAFGQVLEDPDRYLVQGGYRCEGYSFDAVMMREPFALIDRRGIFEAKTTKVYGDAVVVSKADHLFGAVLSEFKTTGSTFDFEKYAASAQWRLMVDAFEPLMVVYHVFSVDDHENGVVTIRDIDSFRLYPYPKLHEDCAELVQAFVAYVTDKGLDGVLRARQEQAA